MAIKEIKKGKLFLAEHVDMKIFFRYELKFPLEIAYSFGGVR